MADMFAALSKTFSLTFFARQVIVILVLFGIGFMLLLFCNGIGKTKIAIIMSACLAYPTGLAVFIVEAYLMLVLGIPYNSILVAIVLFLTAAAFICLSIKSGRLNSGFFKDRKNILLLAVISAAIVAALSCSGLVPISISNDSMYYFHEYPRDIVYFGGLRDQFDSFLTDTGLGSVAIETLPFLFGFNESFGIRECMHICFIAYFICKLYERLGKIVPALLVGGICAISSPVFILGHWAMANMYFMEFFFIAALLAYDTQENKTSDSLESAKILPCAIISIACSLLRMEGGIFILFLIGVFTLANVKGKNLILGIILPIMILLAIYELKIFTMFKIDNPYTFLTPQKAILQGMAFLCLIVYIGIIRERLSEKIKKYIPAAIILALIGANGVLFFYNRELYIANIKAFYQNFMGQSGWGMLPHLSIGSALVLLAIWAIEFIISKLQNREMRFKLKGEEVYLTTLTIGFIFVTVAVSFMRGDALNVQVGDSGNRVMMQVAPLLIYTLTLFFDDAYEMFKKNDCNNK